MAQIKEKQFGGGYDHCLLVNHKTPGDLVFCARLEDPASGRTMEVSTTQPGVQIFTANFGSGAFFGPGGMPIRPTSAFVSKPNIFLIPPTNPNSLPRVLRPGETFREVTVHKFGLVR